MAASGKKAPVLTKKATTKVVKKTTAKKVVADTGKPPKGTVTTAVKKVAVKPATKKSIVAKIAPVESKPVKKPAVKKSSVTKKASPVTPEQRYRMIATAAYFLAERRGFAGGYEMQDWIAAEAETDTRLAS